MNTDRLTIVGRIRLFKQGQAVDFRPAREYSLEEMMVLLLKFRSRSGATPFSRRGAFSSDELPQLERGEAAVTPEGEALGGADGAWADVLGEDEERRLFPDEDPAERKRRREEFRALARKAAAEGAAWRKAEFGPGGDPGPGSGPERKTASRKAGSAPRGRGRAGAPTKLAALGEIVGRSLDAVVEPSSPAFRLFQWMRLADGLPDLSGAGWDRPSLHATLDHFYRIDEARFAGVLEKALECPVRETTVTAETGVASPGCPRRSTRRRMFRE